jgi:hypothetical protein
MGLDYTVPGAVQLLKTVLCVLMTPFSYLAYADGAGLHCTSPCPAVEECALCTYDTFLLPGRAVGAGLHASS